LPFSINHYRQDFILVTLSVASFEESGPAKELQSGSFKATLAATFFFQGALALSRVSVDLHRDAERKQHSIPIFKHLSGLIHNWETAGIDENTKRF
jgi:hypothetical protein